MRILPPLYIALICLPAPGIIAQKVIPPPAGVFEGPGDTLIPFSANGFRFQQIYDGAALAPRSAVLRDISFRRGNDTANQSKTFASYSLNKIAVKMGATTVWPSNMSLAFSKNITTTMVTVFGGTMVLPAQPKSFGPGPFNIQIKLARPFVYTRQLDHLILDIVVTGKNTAKNIYFADKVSGVSGGNVRSFGAGGPLKGSPYLISTTASGALMPGGQVILEVTNLNKVYPVVVAFGFSNSSFGPVALPWDLKGLGAPANRLYVSVDLLFPIPIKKMAVFYGGIANFGVPLTPTIAGAKIFGQGIIVDAASNKLGLVFSNGLEFQIGGRIVAPFQSVYAPDSTANTGKFPHVAPGDKTGGLVTRFTGTFQ